MSDSTLENLNPVDNPPPPQDSAVQDEPQPDQQELPLEMREQHEDVEHMDAVDLASWMSFPASDPPSFDPPGVSGPKQRLPAKRP